MAQILQYETNSMEVTGTLLTSQGLAEAGMDRVQHGVIGQPNVLYPSQDKPKNVEVDGTLLTSQGSS